MLISWLCVVVYHQIPCRCQNCPDSCQHRFTRCVTTTWLGARGVFNVTLTAYVCSVAAAKCTYDLVTDQRIGRSVLTKPELNAEISTVLKKTQQDDAGSAAPLQEREAEL